MAADSCVTQTSYNCDTTVSRTPCRIRMVLMRISYERHTIPHPHPPGRLSPPEPEPRSPYEHLLP